MSLQMLGLLNAHIVRICHGNKTVSMMHLHTARERLSGTREDVATAGPSIYLQMLGMGVSVI